MFFKIHGREQTRNRRLGLEDDATSNQRLAFSILNLLILLLLGIPAVQNVFADSNPTQPVFGFTWPTHSIPVAIDAPHQNARNVVLKAMNTWNLAQQWFIITYMGSAGTPFVFYETNSTVDSMITVTFNQTQTREDLGWTNTHEFHDQQGLFKKVVVRISIDLTWQSGESLSDSELQRLATHELGHALGLDHTTFSTSDLMYHIPKVMAPSTLNLYAVYLLSRATSLSNLPQHPVALPNNIPYEMVSEAELNGVTPPAIQDSTTSSGLAQVLSTISQRLWLFIGIIVVFAGVVVSLVVHVRKAGRKVKHREPNLVFSDNPAIQETSMHTDRSKKKCRHCGMEIPREDLICRNCGMPAVYPRADSQ